MDAPVDLAVSARRSSPLALAPAAGAEEAAWAERLGRELAALEPRIRLTVTEEGAGDVPVFTVAGRIRFVGVPRVQPVPGPAGDAAAGIDRRPRPGRGLGHCARRAAPDRARPGLRHPT